MGAIGCIRTGGQENKEKRGKKRQSGHIFQVRSRARKRHVVDKDGRGGQRGYRGEIMAQQRVRGAIRSLISKNKAKKQTTPPKKTKTSTSKLM